MNLEDLKNNIGFKLSEEFGIGGCSFEAFTEEPEEINLKDALQIIEDLKLSIEIEGFRYRFSSLEKYKEFKKRFNIL